MRPVFNRSGRVALSERDVALAETLRANPAQPYGLSGAEIPAHCGLTAREREVLGWLAAGKTNRDIAEIIGTKPRTVEKHLERVYEKLGVETRTAAVMRACQL